ncbi:MAG: recombinase family protein [Candidatus Pacebacteria bacterium]|jgi:site-specific DNA recombinase|nr:recombinase family protein [Candidatus Paceibacterota bacterium]MBT3512166.1 recombinase family protein [Candidatus Paceibacterota bacterium]MBT4004893.1 recombinase family protein [Candidatus Paceibacterota bacterium]MBT4358665.1 recombinase family protein [Candidatus Paceibacterota bacterium]MBT4681340.1 recombinase family protein [Candidatus Paceibacterota bacterium]
MPITPVFSYYRKSQESEDRQVLSIPSQKEEIQKVASKMNLLIIESFEESKSAKTPGRPIFNQMIERLKSSDVKKILVWNPDRLSRNPVDTGIIIHYQDLGYLEEVITPSQSFTNTPSDKFLLNLLCSQAKLENDNRGINAKRGMKTKASMGWYPQHAPTGYKNTPNLEKGFKTIEKDPDRFDLVQRVFIEILKGREPLSVYREARDKWKLTSSKNNTLARSTFYHTLNNPFYYGEYEWPKNSGNWFKGKHEPMISINEFDQIQKMLGNKGRPISHSHEHQYTGLFRCGACSYGITASKKRKYYTKTQRIANYTYYHCSQKCKGKCIQPPINEKSLETQVIELLGKIRPDSDFIKWAKKWLSVVHQGESRHRETVLSSQNKSLENIEKKLNRLLDLYLNGGVQEEKYQHKKSELEKEKKLTAERLNDNDHTVVNWRKKIESSLDFAHAAQHKFKHGTKDEKRQILLNLGSNLILKDGKIRIDLYDHYRLLSESDNWDEKFNDWIEPQEYTDILAKRPDLVPANPTWLPGLDSNQQP